MTKRTSQALIDQMFALRHKGLTFQEIANQVGCSISIAHTYTKTVPISPEAKGILFAKASERNRSNSQASAIRRQSGTTITSKERAEISRKSLNRHWMKYTMKQKNIKDKLEQKFECEFHKEIIDKAIMHYCSEKYIITVSESYHADTHCVKQLAICRSTMDKRQMLAYVSTRNGAPERRLRKLKVKVFSTQDLNEEV